MRAGFFQRAVRLIQVLVSLTLLLTAADAAAIPIVAGMCDPVGASAPAPAPVMPSRGGAIDVLEDCEQLFSGFGEERPGEDTAALDTATDGPQPAPLTSFTLLRPVGVRARAPGVVRGATTPGHAAGVYRPPRAS